MISQDLKAYYRLEDTSDAIGSYSLTNVGTTTFTLGKINNAATLDGSTQSLTNSTYALVSGPWSVSAWIKADTLPSVGNYMSIVAKYQSAATTGGVDLRLINDGTQKVELYVANTTGGSASYSVSLTTSTWYHLVGVYNGTTVKLYLNGSEVASTNYSNGIATTARNLCIGCVDFTSGNTRFFDGQIDEVGIWHRALSSEEVTTLYNGGDYSVPIELTTSVVSYYKLDESSGNASDSVGSNTLTNSGSSYITAKINNGAEMSGTDRLYAADSTSLSITSSHTIAYWINWSSVAQVNSLINKFLSAGNQQSWLYRYGDNAGTKQFIVNISSNGSSNTQKTYNHTFLTGTWYHLAFVYTASAGTIDIYSNGTLLTQLTGLPTAIFDGTAPLEIGGYENGTNVTSNATFDEVGIWSRALTSTEISSIYNSGDGIQYPFIFIPSVITNTVTDIDITKVTLNGTVVSDNGYTVSERGFVYSETINPTITASNKVIVAGTTGTYSEIVTDLIKNTSYYVRAYAINAIGISYGANVLFTTANVDSDIFYKDINGISGATYAVSLNVGGTVGEVTVKLGTTGYSQVIPAGSGVVTLEGQYGGLTGLIIEKDDATFDGTVDDIYYVLVLGDAVIDWALNSLTNIFPINSSVSFKRVEDKELTRFDMFRYLDAQFKDLDGYVTLTITEEANDKSQNRSKTFVVGNETGVVSPFVKKRISMLSKNQALVIQFSNNKLNETFTICQYQLTGFKEPRKLYKLSKIISI